MDLKKSSKTFSHKDNRNIGAAPKPLKRRREPIHLHFDKPPQEVLAQFNQLTKALIDSSSIIYAHKAGFFNLLPAHIELVTTPEVIAEAGADAETIGLIDCHTKSMCADEKLVYCAVRNNLPVISEDKRILSKLKSTNLPYFNILMMLNYLVYIDAIDRYQYLQFYRSLQSFAWYSPKIWAHGKSVYCAIEKSIQAT